MEQRLCTPDHQDLCSHGTKQPTLSTNNPQAMLELCSVAALSATQSLPSHPRQNRPCRTFSLPYYINTKHTQTNMTSTINPKSTYTSLSISAINLNADSQLPDQSTLSYYRLFYLGKPVSEFYCKTCSNALGHIAPSKCDRCRPVAKNMESLQRTVVGFTQAVDGISVGEYLVSGKVSVPLSLRMRS